MVSLKIQGIDIYVCATIGGIFAILYYVILNNRMMTYVEDHIYSGKWNEYYNNYENK